MACDCVNVGMGTYDNQVVLRPPFPVRGGVAGIDRCIADEIQSLWSAGIITDASCCGHNVAPGFISVADKHISLMEGLGYEHLFNPMNPSDNSCFVPKSVKRNASTKDQFGMPEPTVFQPMPAVKVPKPGPWPAPPAVDDRISAKGRSMETPVQTESVQVTKEKLYEAMLKWTHEHRAGATRGHAEADSLPVEQVAREGSEHLFGLLSAAAA